VDAFEIDFLPPVNAKAEYDNSAKGKARKARYRKTSGRHTTTAKYLSKPFLGIDGESVDDAYVLLSLSNGAQIADPNGLTSVAILSFLCNNIPPSSDCIPVIYGGSLDFNYWVKDLPEHKLEALYASSYMSKGIVHYGFTIRWSRGKTFTVTDKLGNTVTINDVSSFFQVPFVEACDSYLGNYRNRDLLVKFKAIREHFSLDMFEEMQEYNRLEVDLLCELMDELRERCERAGVRPRRWNGPGQMASTLFRRYNVKEHLAHGNIPEAVAQAARYACAGGRFELVRYGMVDNKLSYQYDANSAYTEAMSKLPSLAHGTWRHQVGDAGPREFGLYKLNTAAKNTYHPGPMFTRSNMGSISFPTAAHNWVWNPEMDTIRLWQKRLPGNSFQVIETWWFEPSDPEVKPFGWMAELYEVRRELKAHGDGAEAALKLALSACWGKVCQQIGYLPARGNLPAKIPPYHQLEWAGWVTSYIRAKVYEASLENPSAVIAYETDALFMAEPLQNLTLGTALGEWKMTEYSSLTYVQSGVYFGTKTDGLEVSKSRGFDEGTITRKAVEAVLMEPEKNREVAASLTRFIGLGVALEMPEMAHWLTWIQAPRILRAYPAGKRIHGLCGCDATGESSLLPNYWHQTMCPVREQFSTEYAVLWINPSDMQQKLAEWRLELAEWV